MAKLVAFDGGVFFAGVDRSVPSYSPLSWIRTEGDPEHTQILQPVRSFVPTGEQVAFGGALFIVATDFDHGEELWKSDGTEGGTVFFKDVLLGSLGSSPANLTVLGPTLFFTADDGSGRTLWKSDGTPAGTVKVGDPDAGPVSPSGLTVSNGKIFFAAAGPGGNEPWMSDGTPGGTVRLVDAVPGPSGSDPHAFVTAGTSTAFLAGPAPASAAALALAMASVANAEHGRRHPLPRARRPRSKRPLTRRSGPRSRGFWTSNGTSSPTFLSLPVFRVTTRQMVDPVVFDEKALRAERRLRARTSRTVSSGFRTGLLEERHRVRSASRRPGSDLASADLDAARPPVRRRYLRLRSSFWQSRSCGRAMEPKSGTHPRLAPSRSLLDAGAPVVSGTEDLGNRRGGRYPAGRGIRMATDARFRSPAFNRAPRPLSDGSGPRRGPRRPTPSTWLAVAGDSDGAASAAPAPSRPRRLGRAGRFDRGCNLRRRLSNRARLGSGWNAAGHTRPRRPADRWRRGSPVQSRAVPGLCRFFVGSPAHL